MTGTVYIFNENARIPEELKDSKTLEYIKEHGVVRRPHIEDKFGNGKEFENLIDLCLTYQIIEKREPKYSLTKEGKKLVSEIPLVGAEYFYIVNTLKENGNAEKIVSHFSLLTEVQKELKTSDFSAEQFYNCIKFLKGETERNKRVFIKEV